MLTTHLKFCARERGGLSHYAFARLEAGYGKPL
jgi:hypothetical protein